MFCWSKFVSFDCSLAGPGSSHGDQKERDCSEFYLPWKLLGSVLTLQA